MWKDEVYMEVFEIKSKRELKKMPLSEVETYYRNLRKFQHENDIPIDGIEKKKKNYYQINFLMKLDKIINRRTTKLIGDQRQKTDRPKIYVGTHIGRYDIESSIEIINESAWFLMGDPGETYLNFDGEMLEKAGTIFFDTDDETDRHIALETCVKILKQGGNILLFPEGAWNLETVYPVQELFAGVAEMAIRTGAEIIPIGIEQYYGKFLKHYYMNIGKNISVEGASLSDKKSIAEIVRSKLMDLRWEIWEYHGIEKRASLPNDWNDAKQAYIDSIMQDTENGYTVEEIERTRYHAKNKPPTPDQVFSYLENIEIDSDNAFLAQSVEEYKKNTSKR